MPLGDGTGPLGEGAATGRRRGWCFRPSRKSPAGSILKEGGKSLLQQGWFWTTVVLPLGAAIVKDLTSEDSSLKRIATKIPRLIKSGRTKYLPGGFKNNNI